MAGVAELRGMLACTAWVMQMHVDGVSLAAIPASNAVKPAPVKAVKPAPVKAVKPAAAPTVQQQQTGVQRPQQVQQPQSQQQQQQQRPAAAPASTANFSRAGFSSGGSSLAFRRKGSGPVEFELPAGWRQLAAGASCSPGSGAGGTGGKAAKPSKAAASGKKRQAQQAQQAQQAAFMSPEGLAFPSLPDVQAVVEGPVVVPRKLLRWLRQAAANPLAPAALDAPTTVVGRAHLLAMRRARVATVAADRQQWERRLAVAAAEHASAERLRRRSDG